MDGRTLREWGKEFKGIATALKDVGGGRINRSVIDLVESVKVKRVDRELLEEIPADQVRIRHAEFPEEPDEVRYVYQRVYAVWSDGQLTRHRASDMCEHHTWCELNEFSGSRDDNYDDGLPIACLFNSRADLSHLIWLVEAGERYVGKKTVERIAIVVYKPPLGFHLQLTARAILQELPAYRLGL